MLITFVSELVTHDDIFKQWPKWDLLEFLDFPAKAKKNLCRHYWGQQDTINLNDVFEVLISSERDHRPEYLISPMLDARNIGKTTFLKVIDSMAKVNFGERCNLIWKQKYQQFLDSKRIRGRRQHYYTKPIAQKSTVKPIKIISQLLVFAESQ